MKNILSFILLFVSALTFAQTGSISGNLTDKEYNNEPLAFANVVIKDSANGTTSDFDGNYTIANLQPGTYTIEVSFVGYETQSETITIAAGENVTKNFNVGASAAALDEIVIVATVAKETESALLLEQKKATVIQESIGAERLSKIGVSSAETATTKISGVTKSQGSSSVFIRGLGDRYLSTTMNDLPIPSDDVDKKNISLDLFSTDVLQNVGVAKTYDASAYGDQSSGHINITTKQYSAESKNPKLGLSTGSNTNVLSVFDNFKATANKSDIFLGFHNKNENIAGQITNQTWNTSSTNLPVNYGLSFVGGKKFLTKKSQPLTTLFSFSNSIDYDYKEGDFKNIDENTIKAWYNDVQQYKTEYNTTALLDVNFAINGNSNLQLNNLFVNKLEDNLLEAGNNGKGYVFDQQPIEDGSFLRDQNTKETTLLVNQLLGTHNLTEHNELNWALGSNLVIAEEPNRIRNELILGLDGEGHRFDGQPVDNNFSTDEVRFATNNDFQSRKSKQEILDHEINGYLKDIIDLKDEENNTSNLTIGTNFRYRNRDFNSQFIGVRRLRAKVFEDMNNVDSVINQENIESGTISIQDNQPEDTYSANLSVVSGFLVYNHEFNNTSINVGARYEVDSYDLDWDVQNFTDPETGEQRKGELQETYSNPLLALNLKQALNDKHNIRLAGSRTITLPEFKELAPFEYVTPTGRLIRGNPFLKASTNYNLDLKWEYFASDTEFISVTGFYKAINDPMNYTVLPSAAGVFSFANTGDLAEVRGIEFEGRIKLLETESIGNIKFNTNIAYMQHEQDLYKTYQYKNVEKSGLQGASDIVTNASLIVSNDENEKALQGSINANYASEKIYALGAPRDQNNRDTNYNDQIIENGVVTLDLVLTKKLSDRLSLKGKLMNILNPEIIQTQKLGHLNTDINGNQFIDYETNEIVQSYKKGIDFSLSLDYKF